MSEMNTIYSTATVCLLDDPTSCQTLEPGMFAPQGKITVAACGYLTVI